MSIAAAAQFTWQPNLPLFDPTEPRIMPQDGAAWFTLNWLSAAGKLNRQKAFQLDDLETVLRLTAGQPNLYMSQCLLDRPVRRSPFVLHATHAYVDLDTYRIPGLAGMSRDGLSRDIRMSATTPARRRHRQLSVLAAAFTPNGTGQSPSGAMASDA